MCFLCVASAAHFFIIFIVQKGQKGKKMNKELYEQLLNAGKVMLIREQSRRELLKINEKVNAKKIQLEEMKKEINYNPFGGKKGWGIFLLILGVMGNISMFSSLGPINIKLCLLLCPIWSLLTIFSGIILMLSARKQRKKYIIKATEEYKLEVEKFTLFTNEVTKEVKRKTVEIEKFNTEYECFLDFLPKKYHSIEALGFMMEAVYNLRADTLKEAINLYEDELIRKGNARMQELQYERILYAMQQINENQDRINSNLQDIKTLQFVDIITNN